MNIRPLIPADCRRHALLADPHVTDRLLVVAIAWDYLLEVDATVRALTADRVTGCTGLSDRQYWEAVHGDIPRYVPPDRPRTCQYQGPRGGQCQLSVTQWDPVRDEHTGTVAWIASCRLLTHRAWADKQVADHQAGMRGPAPLPIYNRRSRVAHHFPEINFPVWWERLTARHTEDHRYTPDRDPDRGGEVVLSRPQLRLITQRRVGDQGALL
jgi:hypothetical protein